MTAGETAKKPAAARGWAPAGLPKWVPWAILAAAMVCSAGAVLWVTRGETFLGDEWGYYASYPGFHLKEMFGPRVGHLQIVVILLYKGVVSLFGPSDVAFRLILVTLILVCAGLVYELVRRRVGDWLALAPAILVLSFGSGGETYASTLGITIVITIAFGLTALLLLDRGDLPGDVGAMLLLVAGLATYGPAVAFLAGAAAVIVLGAERPQWRRAWVFAIPAVLYLAWRAWSPPGQGADVHFTFENVLHLPNSILDSIAATLAAASGLFRVIGGDAPPVIPLGWGQALLVVLIAGTVLLFAQRKGKKLDRWIWAALAMPLVYWGAIAAASSAARPPAAARYQLLGAIFIVLIYAVLAEGVKVSRRAAIVVFVVFGIGVAANLGALGSFGQRFRANSDENRAELAMLELVRDHVDPNLSVEVAGPGVTVPDLLIPAQQYFAIADAHGSPAFSIAQVQAAPEAVRQAADAELIRALGIAAQPSTQLPRAGTAPGGPSIGMTTTAAGACVNLKPNQPGASADLSVPPGGFSIEASPGAPPALSLRRFADAPAAPLPAIAVNQPQVVDIPTDASHVPWHLGVAASAPVTVCSLT